MDWEDTASGERYVVLLCRTSSFRGPLLSAMERCPHFGQYLRVFMEEDKTEFYGRHHGDGERSATVL